MTEIFKCPECGSKLECMCVIRADESSSGYNESLFHCRNCLRDWQNIGNTEELQRKFWG